MSLTQEDLSAISSLLDTRLDVRFAEQDAKLDARFTEQDAKFDMRFAQQETKFDTKLNTKIDSLAAMVKAGFDEVTDRLNQVESDISELKSDVTVLKQDVSELKTDMREVKWSLADTVRRAEFLDLRQRVEQLELQRAA